MKEYIERAHLLKNLGYDETRRADVLPGSTFDIVLKEPAADVAEVRHGRLNFLQEDMVGCYCRECKYFIEASDWPIPIGGRNTQCIKVQSTRKPDDFCSEGKKKEPD